MCQQLWLVSWSRVTEDVRLNCSSDGLIDTSQMGVGEPSQGSSKLYSSEIMRGSESREGEGEREIRKTKELNGKTTKERLVSFPLPPLLRSWSLGQGGRQAHQKWSLRTRPASC